MKSETTSEQGLDVPERVTMTSYEALLHFLKHPDQIDSFIATNIPESDTARWHAAFEQFDSVRGLVHLIFCSTAERDPHIVTRTLLFTYLTFRGESDTAHGFHYATQHYLEPMTSLLLMYFSHIDVTIFGNEDNFTYNTLYYLFFHMASDYRFYQQGEVEHQALFEGLIDTHLTCEKTKQVLKDNYDINDFKPSSREIAT